MLTEYQRDFLNTFNEVPTREALIADLSLVRHIHAEEKDQVKKERLALLGSHLSNLITYSKYYTRY